MRRIDKPRPKRSKERYPKPRLQSSAEFESLALAFIEGLDDMGDTMEEILRTAVSPFRGEARLKLRKYLDDITADRFPDAELTRLWNATPANVVFYEQGGLRIFLRLIRDRL